MLPDRALRDLAQRMMPAGFGCAVLPLDAAPTVLLPQEQAVIACAVPKRRQEFALGRMALRMAIREAGHQLAPSRAIAALPDRLPDLPPGIHASLSHSGDHCIVIAAPPDGPSVGVDIEPMGRPIPENLTEMVMPYRLPAGGDALLAFCIKEALFKAQFPLTRRMLDFSDVPAVIAPGRFRACLGDRLIGGKWGIAGGYYLAISLWRG